MLRSNGSSAWSSHSFPATGSAAGRQNRRSRLGFRLGFNAALCALALSSLAGCKSKPAVDDVTLARTIQSQISSDTSLGGQPVQTSVQNGVATLTGSVQNDAQRTIAARDAAGVAGVKEVVNNISIGTLPPASASVATAPVAPVPVAPVPVAPAKSSALVQPARTERERREERERLAAQNHQPAPIERNQPAQQPPFAQQAQPAAVAPPPPPQPVFRTLTVAAGETIPVRITQALDSATTQTGDSFSGTVASDVVEDGLVAIPAGSLVSGKVDVVQEAAHFKGSSLLTVSLVSVARRGGERVDVSTEPYTVSGKGRGKNTAEKVGGGAAVGAVLGGIFGGGKGAAIGAAAGGGLGAGSQAVTRGQQVQIPSESVVRFRLSSPITLRVRADRGARPVTNRDDSGELQRRPNE